MEWNLPSLIVTIKRKIKYLLAGRLQNQRHLDSFLSIPNIHFELSEIRSFPCVCFLPLSFPLPTPNIKMYFRQPKYFPPHFVPLHLDLCAALSTQSEPSDKQVKLS